MLAYSTTPWRFCSYRYFYIKIFASLKTSAETNSPPLSLSAFDGLAKLLMVGLLPLIMVALLSRVNPSIICKYQIFLLRLWRSIPTVWLDVFALGNATVSLGGGFLMGFAFYTVIANFIDKLWNFCRKQSCIFQKIFQIIRTSMTKLLKPFY